MKKLLTILLLLSFPAYAGSERCTSFETVPNPDFIMCMPEGGMVPTGKIDCLETKTPDTTDAQGKIIVGKIIKSCTNSADYIAYQAWVKAGHAPKTHVFTKPIPDEKSELKKQLEILQLKAQIKSLSEGGN